MDFELTPVDTPEPLSAMGCELDHLFVYTAVGAPESEQLLQQGLVEGAPNTHPGQGTACRRFFFHNAYIELLWVNDPVEAHSDLARPTRLGDRWARRGVDVCPFGVILRPQADGTAHPPFKSREYRPPYLPASQPIFVGVNSNVFSEPLLFYLPFHRRPDGYPIGKRPPLQQAIGLTEITRVELVTPHSSRSTPELATVIQSGRIQLRPGPEYLAEVGFDGEPSGKSIDLRPTLPLALFW
jgi:hypothetical protein